MEEEIKISSLEEAFRILKGTFSGGVWIVLFVCSLLAIFISIYLQYMSRRKKGKLNPISPDKFSLFYSIVDNFLRIVVGMITMFFIFRLASAVLNPSWVANNDMLILLGLGVGFAASFGIDRLIMKLMEKSNILNLPNPYDELKKQIINEGLIISKPDQK